MPGLLACHLRGLLERKRKIFKSDFVRLCNGSLSFHVDLREALYCCAVFRAGLRVCLIAKTVSWEKASCNNETATDWLAVWVSRRQDCVGEAGCRI